MFQRMSVLRVVLSLFCVITLLPVSGFAMTSEEAAQFTSATVSFGSDFPDTSQIAIVGGGGGALVERDGRIGTKTDISSKVLYYYLDVNDKLIYDVPDLTPIDITVEYFDEGKGWFGIGYESWHPQDLTTDGRDWRFTDEKFLTDTKTWKSYTFHLEDARLANGCNNNADFRLCVWDPIRTYSPEDVIFGSVTVSRSDYEEPVSFTADTSERLGNIFSADEDITLRESLGNKLDKTAHVKYSGRVFDSNGAQLEQISPAETDIEPKGTGTIKIPITNPKTYALYTMELDTEITYPDEPGHIYTNTYTREFSVARLLSSEDANPFYGTTQQIIQQGRSDAPTVSELMKMGGIKFLRDDPQWTQIERQKGVLNIPGSMINTYRVLHDNGIEPLANLGLRNNLYDNGEAPHSEEGLNAFANYCGYLARELKGIVKYYEIYNEWNISAFNQTNEPAETYAELMKRSYKAIKEADPDAYVIGMCTSQVPIEWIRRVLDAGGFDYCDAISVHPYDWSQGYREYETISTGRQLRELVDQYGKGKPIWYTEAGFSSYKNETGVPGKMRGYSRKEQASALLLYAAVCRAYDLCDMLCQYAFQDRNSPTELEYNWGFLNWWGTDNNPVVPNSAKESFLAISTMNTFWGKGSEFKDKIADEDERVYAFDFYNNDMKKDVLYLAAGMGCSGTRSYDLGARSVSVYDMYGNLISDLYSDSGVYTFNITETPFYVIGNFEKFAESESGGLIKGDAAVRTAATDDIVTYTFTADTNEPLSVKVLDNPAISVREIRDFANGSAQLVMRTAADAEGLNQFTVLISDANGRVRDCRIYTVEITDPISLTVATEHASANSDTHWRARLTVRNNRTDGAVSGTVGFAAPESLAEDTEVKKIVDLKPGKEMTFLINLPEKITKRTYDATAEVKLDSGFTLTQTKLFDFGSAAYTDKPPEIDGVLGDGEWIGSWIGADEQKDFEAVSGQTHGWNGPSDCSVSCCLMWDDDNLYLLSIVTDDVYSTNFSPIELSGTYKEDSVQFAVDPRETFNNMTTSDFTEICLGELPGFGPKVYRSKSFDASAIPAKVEVETAKLAIKRYDTYTVFECAVPWAELLGADYKPSASSFMHFSMLANDNDGAERHGWMEYTSGVGRTKDASQFGTLTLIK